MKKEGEETLTIYKSARATLCWSFSHGMTLQLRHLIPSKTLRSSPENGLACYRAGTDLQHYYHALAKF